MMVGNTNASRTQQQPIDSSWSVSMGGSDAEMEVTSGAGTVSASPSEGHVLFLPFMGLPAPSQQEPIDTSCSVSETHPLVRAAILAGEKQELAHKIVVDSISSMKEVFRFMVSHLEGAQQQQQNAKIFISRLPPMLRHSTLGTMNDDDDTMLRTFWMAEESQEIAYSLIDFLVRFFDGPNRPKNVPSLLISQLRSAQQTQQEANNMIVSLRGQVQEKDNADKQSASESLEQEAEALLREFEEVRKDFVVFLERYRSKSNRSASVTAKLEQLNDQLKGLFDKVHNVVNPKRAMKMLKKTVEDVCMHHERRLDDLQEDIKNLVAALDDIQKDIDNTNQVLEAHDDFSNQVEELHKEFLDFQEDVDKCFDRLYGAILMTAESEESKREVLEAWRRMET